MKLSIEENPQLSETEVIIRCQKLDDTAMAVISAVRSLEQKVLGVLNGRMFVMEPGEILYCESVDKRTFLYTSTGVYETPMHLYELEERYSGSAFFRAGKALVVNIRKIKVLNPLLGGRIEVVLESGEKLMVSRQYAPFLKEKLGI